MRYLALDGNSLIFRAYFALARSDLKNSRGFETGAIHGFLSMLASMIDSFKPDGIGVAFDLPDPTFRHAMVEEYKGGRKETPTSLIDQLKVVTQILEKFGIQVLTSVGYEADDILATIAKFNIENGDETYVVTGDRDCFQLVKDPFVKVVYTVKGVSNVEVLDEDGILERTGVIPEKYPLFASLRGDPSDNLPGVSGIGPKTAATLVNTYGDIEGILSNLNELRPKVKEALESSRNKLQNALEVVKLIENVPLKEGSLPLRFEKSDFKSLDLMFSDLEITNVYKRLKASFKELKGDKTESDDSIIDNKDKSADLNVEFLTGRENWKTLVDSEQPNLAIHAKWSGLAGRSNILCLALVPFDDGDIQSAVSKGLVVDEVDIEGFLSDQTVQAFIGSKNVFSFQGKELVRRLYSFNLNLSIYFDIQIAAYLVEPKFGRMSFDELCGDLLGVSIESSSIKQGTFALGFEDDAAKEMIKEMSCFLKLIPDLSEKLKDLKLTNLCFDIEMPVEKILAKMEIAGIYVDCDKLREISNEFERQVNLLKAEIEKLAGRSFNLSSPKQLSQVLYDELHLNPGRKIKTGRSTDARSLEKLVNDHPIISYILKFRELEKLRTTYGTPLESFIEDDERIHATFSQTIARTGRLSSESPNLHNIPVRSEEGRKIRSAFKSIDNFTFVAADFNQIELRVIAHLSNDKSLIEAFKLGVDVHSQVASRVFAVDIKNVEPSMRNKAKMVNYGLAYGMEAFGLAQRLQIEVSEAKEILESFFKEFPSIKGYMDDVIDRAKRDGYTETIFKRRRPLPDLTSNDWTLRSAAQRQAMNAVVQGSAADIFKLALIAVDLGLNSLKAKIVLQVHDEIIVECPDYEVAEVEELLKVAMPSVVSLQVPLDVEISKAKTWSGLKE